MVVVETRKELTRENLINNIETIYTEGNEKFKIVFEVNGIGQDTFVLYRDVTDYDCGFRLVDVYTNYWKMIKVMRDIINK